MVREKEEKLRELGCHGAPGSRSCEGAAEAEVRSTAVIKLLHVLL